MRAQAFKPTQSAVDISGNKKLSDIMLIQCLPLGLQVANSPFTMSVHSYAPKGMCVLLN